MRTLTLFLLALAVTTGAWAQNTLPLVWQGVGEVGLNYFGSGACGGDFNGDGYSDVVIGEPGWNHSSTTGQGGWGRDFLYFGSPDFIDTAAMVFHGDSAWDGFDISVANIQDINADGQADLLIPASGSWHGGYVEIFFGGEIFDTLADWRLQKHANSWGVFFGTTTDSAGDVNGDGFADFIVSGSDFFEETSYVEIYLGGPDLDTLADWRIDFAGSWREVFGLGNINGDAYDDILIYNPGMIFLGGDPMDTLPDLQLGTSIVCGGGAGDLNADGYGDWVVYKTYASPADSIHTAVYFGSATPDTIKDVILQGVDTPYARSFDFSHADVNGDGYADLLANGSSEIPIMTLYLGGPWFNGVPDWWHTEYYMWESDYSFYGVGDVNGDGCDELLLGIPGYDGLTWADVGVAKLYAGNPDLIDQGAGISPEEIQRHPGWFVLEQNYPNPFNGSTAIGFQIGKPSTVTLTIYDLRGQKIKTLIQNQAMNPGGYTVSWGGRNDHNQAVASGLYLLALQVEQYRQIQKMILMK